MAAAVSFDEIIQAGRQKRKNEELANRILGKNRNASASSVSTTTNKATSKSLASRIGKRPASTTGSKQRNRPSSRPRPVNKRRPDEERLVAALDPASGQAKVRENPVGMTIRGSSGLGPFVVIGSNFAPGTTAADIQSAVEPMSGPILSCRVISVRPTVTAEMVFAEKWTAENVVANFHNQRADGRVLSMRLQQTGTGATLDSDALNNPPAALSSFQSPQPSYDVLREQADRERRNRRADPEIQDGGYGFAEDNQAVNGNRYNNRRANAHSNTQGGRRSFARGKQSKQETKETGLYSDQMMVDAPPQQNSRNRGRRQR